MLSLLLMAAQSNDDISTFLYNIKNIEFYVLEKGEQSLSGRFQQKISLIKQHEANYVYIWRLSESIRSYINIKINLNIRPRQMRFEAQLKRDKLKSCQMILSMTISLIKARQVKFSVYFIYVASQNQIRILLQSQSTPVVIVLQAEIFSKIISVSKNETTNTSIGFQFKNGLSFLENFLCSIREDSGNINLVTEQEKILSLKITKSEDFRALEIKSNNKLRRQEIEKPTKNENDLFSYQWIDGVTHSSACVEVNPAGIIQILKVVSKSKNHYIVQILPEKKLQMEIDTQNMKFCLKLKTLQSPLEINSKFIRMEGPFNGKCLYEAKIDDAEVLMLAIKNECVFIIDEQKNLSISYSLSDLYNCQISLKNLVTFLMSESVQEQGGMLKREN